MICEAQVYKRNVPSTDEDVTILRESFSFCYIYLFIFSFFYFHGTSKAN